MCVCVCVGFLFKAENRRFLNFLYYCYDDDDDNDDDIG